MQTLVSAVPQIGLRDSRISAAQIAALAEHSLRLSCRVAGGETSLADHGCPKVTAKWCAVDLASGVHGGKRLGDFQASITSDCLLCIVRADGSRMTPKQRGCRLASP